MRYQKYIFFLVLLFLPTQLGKHFWPNFSYVLGQRIDYLSPTVYLTDILIAILFLSDFKKVYRFFKEHFIGLLGCWVTGLLLSFFWIFFQNQSIGLLFYKWLKLFEFLFFIFWIKKNVKMEEILLPLSLGVLGESLLAWLEFLTQGSLGFWILGERSFHISTPGIALANLQGRLALRPYATFPHPNVLAGYTLVVLIFALFLREQSKFLRLLTLILGTSVIFISFSRTVWTVWFLIIISWLWIRKKDLVLPSLFFLSFGNESVWRRLELTDAAFKIFKTSPIFGVGLGNFITQLPKFLVPKKLYFWQPVHNIFLLILAETGIIGIWFMVYGVWFIFRKLWQEKNLALLYSFFAIILTGFFDHYWLTLQQTQLLLALIIGLSIKSKNVLE